MRSIIILGVFFTLLIGGFSLFWFSTEQVVTRQIRSQFEEFSEVMATQKREDIATYINRQLAEDSTVHLEVSFSALGLMASAGAGKPMLQQDFTKAAFLTFIDNILYSLNSYQASMELEKITLSDDKTTAAIEFKTRASGAGGNMIMGTNTPTRWVLNADCKGEVKLGDALQFKTIDCKSGLMQQPDLNKVNLQDMMQQIQKP